MKQTALDDIYKIDLFSYYIMFQLQFAPILWRFAKNNQLI